MLYIFKCVNRSVSLKEEKNTQSCVTKLKC